MSNFEHHGPGNQYTSEPGQPMNIVHNSDGVRIVPGAHFHGPMYFSSEGSGPGYIAPGAHFHGPVHFGTPPQVSSPSRSGRGSQFQHESNRSTATTSSEDEFSSGDQYTAGTMNFSLPNTININGRVVRITDGSVVNPVDLPRQPTRNATVTVIGRFNNKADNFVYVPVNGRGLPAGAAPYPNTGKLAAAIPIVVGDKHVYLISKRTFQVLSPAGAIEIHNGTSVKVGETTVWNDEFKKVPIAYVPLNESDSRTASSTKPAGPCPPETSPYKPVAIGNYLVYFDGLNVFVYGETFGYQGFQPTSNGYIAKFNGRNIGINDFRAVRIEN